MAQCHNECIYIALYLYIYDQVVNKVTILQKKLLHWLLLHGFLSSVCLQMPLKIIIGDKTM